MDKVVIANCIITAVFFICYAHQFFYMLAHLVLRDRPRKEGAGNRYAVLIAARNEEKVISRLIESVHSQSYPGKLITVFVVADNCTDATAEVSESAGAKVYERSDSRRVGKGYALDYLLRRIDADYPGRPFDGYFVFDADNVLDERYISEMNKTFSDGYEIVTSYRNSKNYGDNWVSAGHSLWFMRESRYLNHSRMLLNTSCAVSGTGFMFSREVIERLGGWKYFLLTEDLEFTAHSVIEGEKIGYCPTAVFYDEQPVSFAQSWRQRKRWTRGSMQVLRDYGRGLTKGVLRGSFSCFDMVMSSMPAAVLTIAGMLVNISAVLAAVLTGRGLDMLLKSIAEGMLSSYLTLLAIGAVTTASEWKRIYASPAKKLAYVFTFPVFVLTSVPIAVSALLCRSVAWTPIEHTRSVDVSDIRGAKLPVRGSD